MKRFQFLLLSAVFLIFFHAGCSDNSGSISGSRHAAPADLIVLNPEASNLTPSANANFRLSITVQNNGGTATTADAALTYYLSDDDIIDSSNDTEVGTVDTIPSGLAAKNAGGTDDESPQDTTVKAPIANGTYYYGACVTLAGESETTNNCSSAVQITVTISLNADLIVLNAGTSSANPSAGTMFRLSVTVQNNGGTATTADAALTYYLSDDGIIDSSNDTEVGTVDTIPSGLAAKNDGGTDDESPQDTRVTALSPGIYYYGACVTLAGESETTNNCSSAVKITVPTPADLIVVNTQVSNLTPSANANFRLSVTVQNDGGTATNADAALTYYLSDDDIIGSSNDTEVGTEDTIPSGLAAKSDGGTDDESPQDTRVTAPIANGTYYYGACVTLAGESDTVNNCSSAVQITVTISLSADLIVLNPEASNLTPSANANFRLSVTVQNNGGTATAADAALTYYLSDDGIIDSSNDTEVGTEDTIPSGLAAKNDGGTDDESPQDTMITALSPGIYYYGACVRLAGESETTNNCSSAVKITVPTPADLIVVNPEASNLTPSANTNFRLSVTVQNNGGTATTADAALIYYLSDDGIIDSSNDTEVGTVDTIPSGLAAKNDGGTDDESPQDTRITAPSPGTYYYGACVRLPGESETTNNCSSAVKITVPTPADLIVVNPEASNLTPSTNTNFRLSVTVQNNGGTATNADAALIYYLSDDDIIDSSNDTEVGTVDTIPSGLAAKNDGGTDDESPQDTRVTALSPGIYYYGACVTLAGESETTNNCSSAVQITVPTPADLIVVNTQVSNLTPSANANFRLSVTVQNDGGTATNADAALTYYLSDDDIIGSSNDTEVGTEDTIPSGLAAKSDGGTDDESPQDTRVTAPIANGTYYYGACVTLAGESDTVNNCSSAVQITVTISISADLIVLNPEASNLTPSANANFRLSVTVQNNGGTATAADAALTYYLSDDGIIDSSNDTEVGTVDTIPSGLAAKNDGGIDDESPQDTMVTALSPDIYYYGACVRLAGESDTTNNCSSAVQITVPTPADLIVVNPEASNLTPSANTNFRLSVIVQNNGGTATTADAALIYYLSDDGIIDSSNDTEVGTEDTIPSGLAAKSDGGTDDESPQDTMITALSPGTYYYGACVTLAGESDTTNNCSSAVQITVPTPADLIVVNPEASNLTPSTNTNFRLSVTVQNNGGTATNADAALIYYLSDDGIIDSSNDTEVGTEDTIPSGLAAKNDGGTDDESPQDTMITALSPGTYYYGACVTLAGESDTTNNCSSAVQITVPTPADLIVVNPETSNLTPSANTNFRLSVTVQNNGGTPTAADAALTYYLSDDDIIDSSNDTEVGTEDTIPSGLAAKNDGGTDDESPQDTMITALSPGIYYYGACVTLAGESDTTNNCSSAVKITVPTPADLIVVNPEASNLTPSANANFRLSVTVQNDGGTATTADAALTYYLSDDDIIDSSNDTEVGTADTIPSGLAAKNDGGTDDESPQATRVRAPLASGTYYYGACVRLPGESETTNNCSSAVRITVPTPADLIVVNTQVSNLTPSANANFRLSATVQNNGETATNADAVLTYYLSDDDIIDSSNDTEVGTEDTIPSGLAAKNDSGTDDESPQNTRVTAPITNGTYYYGACVRLPGESETANNCSSAVKITVTIPLNADLIVLNVGTSSATPSAGTMFRLSVTVQNNGGTATTADAALTYYLSDDGTIDSSNDTEVGTVDTIPSGLAAKNDGGTDDESPQDTMVTAPSRDGPYYYGACVTLPGESDTDNNCSSAVKIVVPSNLLAPVEISQNRYGYYSILWSRVPGSDRYELEESCSDEENSILNWSVVSSSFGTQRLLGPKTHQLCYFRVRACDNGICGSWAFSSKLDNLLILKDDLRSDVFDAYDGTYTIDWGGLPNAAYYELDESENGQGWVRVLLEDRTKNLQSFSNREKGNRYRYRARACGDDDICGPWKAADSDLVRVSFMKPVLNIFGTDERQHTVFGADGAFRLYWTAAPGTLRYELQEKAGSAAFADLRGDLSTISHSINGKKGPAQYEYRVRACTETNGPDEYCGDWSETVLVDVPLASVQGLALSDTTRHASSGETSYDGTYKVDWELLRGYAYPIHYELQEKDANGSWPADDSGQIYSGSSAVILFQKVFFPAVLITCTESEPAAT